MKEEEKFELEIDYAFKVIHDDLPFDKIRLELEQLSIPDQEISVIIRKVDDIVLLNTVENKLIKGKYQYKKSGIGILITILFFLFYLAYSYKLIQVEGIETGTLIFVFLVISFFLYKNVKKPAGKFTNRNKFKNN